MSHEFGRFAAKGRIDEDRNLHRIPVHRVVRSELEMPSEPARIGVERDQAFGVKIIALADIAVEIGGRIADAPDQEIGFGVVAAGQPGIPAAGFPRISRPGLVSRFAGAWNRVPAPDTLSSFGVIGVEEALRP